MRALCAARMWPFVARQSDTSKELRLATRGKGERDLVEQDMIISVSIRKD
jgi:hypothetical protein